MRLPHGPRPGRQQGFPRQMILLKDHQGRQEFRVVQRAPPPDEGLRGENPQSLMSRLDTAEMRLPSPDRDDNLTRHAVAPLDRIEGRRPLLQEAHPRLCQGGELVFREIVLRTLELCLPLVLRRCRQARRLELRKVPVERHPNQAALERVRGDAMFLRLRPDGSRQPVPEMRLSDRPCFQRLCLRPRGPSGENGA